MKTLVLALLFLVVAVPAALAEVAAVPKEKDQPCLRIEQACQDAGFVKGGAKEGKGLIVDCVKPLLEGKSILGVTVDGPVIQACREKIKARRAPRDQDKVDPGKTK